MKEVLVPLVAEARAGSLTYVIQPERAIYLAIWDSGAYKLICWLDPMSLNIEKKAREPRPSPPRSKASTDTNRLE